MKRKIRIVMFAAAVMLALAAAVVKAACKVAI